MVTDSTTNPSIPMAPKDFAKKKRANRSAKLKQCKLDARREQWLSQVKNKGCKDEADVSVHARNERVSSMGNLDMKALSEKNEGSIHHCSDSDSPSNSPTSHTSSVLGGNASGMNFTSSSGGSSSRSSSSGGSCSGEDEEGDDGCLDDWEAVADALAGTDDKQEQHNPSSDPSLEHETMAPLDSPLESTCRHGSRIEKSKPKPERVETVQRAPPKCRAWKHDDAFRPRTLPNLPKQLSLPMNSGRQYGCRAGAWVPKNVVSAPSVCPVCYEDLDLTDSSFHPCSCGFILCLFCHKRILEDNGRCPGCRKQYEYEPVKGEATLDGGSLTFRLAQSCSMITRS